MNRYEPNFIGGREAKLRYLSGDYQVVTPGDFVRCAVTGEPIPLDQLRYWDPDLQEAYSSPEVSFKRYLEVHGRG
ncbi:DUF2093 domain-containing protein [Kaustia mangrovi]|uniref:DUF2093 domain-containing protein n=1 Tax=Kaustia mangrovi TaxID=2593653 RepID=A0A7S8C7J1_9HYPH|nr:DUF2093 domain-containing protein [Kaustia mangrovi]QPC44868.1 DUF2093 domain-containing protein [Kaustia mangrovi]